MSKPRYFLGVALLAATLAGQAQAADEGYIDAHLLSADGVRFNLVSFDEADRAPACQAENARYRYFFATRNEEAQLWLLRGYRAKGLLTRVEGTGECVDGIETVRATSVARLR